MNYDCGEGCENLGIALASNGEHVLGTWADLFARIHARTSFNLQVLSSSCALTADGYFEGANLAKITNHGKAITGEQQHKIKNKLLHQ